MSRSNNTDLVNPAQRFFEWKGDTGSLQWYDKEKGENQFPELPFRFLVLDILSGVTGGKTVNGNYEGYWSNSVRNTKTQMLVVRSKSGTVARGFYEDIKKHDGIKFQQLVYIAYYDADKNLQIGCLKLHGAAVSAWFDFRKGKDVYAGGLMIKGKSEELKNGNVKYFAPVFDSFNNLSPETEAKAVELDVHLQEYLTTYFAQAGIEEVEAEYTGQDYAPDTTQEPPDYVMNGNEENW